MRLIPENDRTVEAVARALAAAEFGVVDTDDLWDRITGGSRAEFMAQARAAIRAINGLMTEGEGAGQPPDECDNCNNVMDGDTAATSDVCLDCWRSTKEENVELRAFLARAIKYAREDRMTTPGGTRLARVLAKAEAHLSVPSQPTKTDADVGEGDRDAARWEALTDAMVAVTSCASVASAVVALQGLVAAVEGRLPARTPNLHPQAGSEAGEADPVRQLEEAMYAAVEEHAGSKVADAWGDMEYFVAAKAAMQHLKALPSPSGGRQGGGEDERKYPCIRCGTLRTKAEGGTTFTTCDACWDRDNGKAPVDVAAVSSPSAAGVAGLGTSISPLLVPTQPQGPEPEPEPVCTQCLAVLPALPVKWREWLFCGRACLEVWAEAHGVGVVRPRAESCTLPPCYEASRCADPGPCPYAPPAVPGTTGEATCPVEVKTSKGRARCNLTGGHRGSHAMPGGVAYDGVGACRHTFDGGGLCIMSSGHAGEHMQPSSPTPTDATTPGKE